MSTLRTTEGKWVVFSVTTGQRFERWPVDARAMLESGHYTANTPKGDSPVASVASGLEQSAPAPTSTLEIPLVIDPKLDPAHEPTDPVPHVTRAAEQNNALSPTGAPLVIGAPATVKPAQPVQLPTARVSDPRDRHRGGR